MDELFTYIFLSCVLLLILSPCFFHIFLCTDSSVTIFAFQYGLSTLSMVTVFLFFLFTNYRASFPSLIVPYPPLQLSWRNFRNGYRCINSSQLLYLPVLRFFYLTFLTIYMFLSFVSVPYWYISKKNLLLICVCSILQVVFIPYLYRQNRPV